jgi:hypothetical protein
VLVGRVLLNLNFLEGLCHISEFDCIFNPINIFPYKIRVLNIRLGPAGGAVIVLPHAGPAIL